MGPLMGPSFPRCQMCWSSGRGAVKGGVLHGRRPRFAALLALAAGSALAVAAGVLACATSTTATPVTTTGIVVPATTLTAERGCGTAPSNVFKYVVVVFGYEGHDASPEAGTSY